MRAEPADLTKPVKIEDVAEAGADDERYWSVTTIVGCLDKPALVPWAALETSKAAINEEQAWRSRLTHEGPASAIDYLKNARFRRPKGQRSPKDLGTAVHGLCETYALTGVRPQLVDAELRPFLDQFDRFLQEFQPEYIAAEYVVFNETYGYAGQADGAAKLEGTPVLIDYKTSRESFDGRGRPKAPYPEVALQLAAYRYAEFAAVWRARRFQSEFSRRYYLLSDEERRQGADVPKVEGGVAIFLSPDRYAVHPVRCDEAVFERFLYVQEAARWSFQMAGDVVFPALGPLYPLPVDDRDPFRGLPQ